PRDPPEPRARPGTHGSSSWKRSPGKSPRHSLHILQMLPNSVFSWRSTSFTAFFRFRIIITFLKGTDNNLCYDNLKNLLLFSVFPPSHQGVCKKGTGVGAG